MSRILFLLLVLLPSLYASVLLNVNVYERAHRLDLMLSFDTPFEGTITKREERDGTIAILLGDVQVRKPFYRAIRESFVDSVTVAKSDADTALVKIVPTSGPLGVKASKTVDGFGLRLRIYPITTPQHAAVPPMPALLQKEAARQRLEERSKRPQPLNTLDERETLPSWRYWSVLGVLLLLLLLLWSAKRKGLRNLSKNSGAGWLMPNKGKGAIPEEATVRFKKPIDPHNHVVLLEFAGRQYLMVVGTTNLLLDTFSAGHIQEEEDFSQVFEANKRQLDHFLKENHPDAYEAFKANASKEEHP